MSHALRDYLPLLPVGAAFLLVFAGLKQFSEVREVERLRPIANVAAERSGVDPNLVLAVVTKESGGDPLARSSAGAVGLMQLKLSAAADAAVRLGEPPPTETELLNSTINLRLGASYIKILLDRYQGATDVALAAYLKGPQWVAKQGGIEGVRAFLQKPSEIATYVNRVQDLAVRMKVRAGDDR